MKIRIFFILILVFTFTACKEITRNDIKLESAISPLERLIEGNKRFNNGKPLHPDQTLERIRNLKIGQHPFAVVLSCSDSRVPPELIFDQGLGDIFSIRTAGNVIGDYELGSIEYAVEHLHCNLIVVLGHENCGAIDAYIHSGKEKHHDHIQLLIDHIADEPEEKDIPDSLKHDINYAVNANIKHGVNFLKNSEPILKGLHQDGKVNVVGAIYDLDSGIVSFLN